MISIVTPVRNGGKTIARTIRSVSQQAGDHEHIIMDGGSSDDTLTEAAAFRSDSRLKIYSKKDRSMYEGVLNGFAVTTGEVMSYINADDFYLPWTLATVAAIFRDHPNVSWITGIPSWYYENAGTQVTSPYCPVFPRWAIRAGYCSSPWLGFLQQESMFWRRSLWDRDPEGMRQLLLKFKLGADYHLWRNFARFSALTSVSSVLACFCISDSQLSGVNQVQYMRECGLRSDNFEKPVFGKILLRVISTVMARRVVRVVRKIRP